MKWWLILGVSALILFSCSSQGIEVTKPRYHKSWYKHHRWNKRYKIGRLQVRPFERQGVRKVKMN